jgi:hypothetical protein
MNTTDTILDIELRLLLEDGHVRMMELAKFQFQEDPDSHDILIRGYCRGVTDVGEVESVSIRLERLTSGQRHIVMSEYNLQVEPEGEWTRVTLTGKSIPT